MADHYLRVIRTFELGQIKHAFGPAPARILEVGAGSGWQAQLLLDAGYDVRAIDLASNPFLPDVGPVTVYDGKTFPFEDKNFDLVYVSNVLDHVKEWEKFSEQVHRVLKPGGKWILVVPTTEWAFWNLIFYFFKMPVFALAKLRQRRAKHEAAGTYGGLRGSDAKYLFGPHRLGERGTALSEITLFSNQKRIDFFNSTGWRVASQQPLHLFYTGVRLAGPFLSMRARQKLSGIMGSACRLYVLESLRK